MQTRLLDFLDENSKKLLGIAEEKATPESKRKIQVDENDRLIIKLNSDENDRTIFSDGFISVYSSLGLSPKERRIINENPAVVRAGFLEIISFHLERVNIRTSKKPIGFDLAVVDSEEVQKMLSEMIKLGKRGYHFFSSFLIPLYLRIKLTTDDKNRLIDDLDNLKLSFASLLCVCVGRKTKG
ncbi:MAG: hypothetical protein Q7T51_00300 [Candidatus Moranbacteria bacterium]|nr:hypothetical protein [Candidatus Moranbacteria bacterium]